MGLLDQITKHIADLNPEIVNSIGGLLNYGKDRAKYIGGLLDDSAPINQDLQRWHKRTQLGLADQLAGKQSPDADYAYSQMMNMAGVAPVGMTAWHGSPHKFDKFSLDKIGTGEGAQAYGHGLYLAESPEVARSYLKSNGPGEDLTVTLGGKDVAWGSDLNQQQLDAIKFLEGGKRQAGQFPHNTAYYAKKMTDDPALHKLIDEWKDAKIGYKSHSTMYKTDIPDEAVARFLDWDKPLSQQAPEVQRALLQADRLKFGKDGETLKQWTDLVGDDAMPMRQTGQDLIASESRQVGGQDAMSQYLKELGIPGIRYLDGGSRSAGQGSSNFVAFDPDMIRILERNGQPTGQQPWALGEWLKVSK